VQHRRLRRLHHHQNHQVLLNRLVLQILLVHQDLQDLLIRQNHQ
jgi:hypothetical protein